LRGLTRLGTVPARLGFVTLPVLLLWIAVLASYSVEYSPQLGGLHQLCMLRSFLGGDGSRPITKCLLFENEYLVSAVELLICASAKCSCTCQF
jgi:hypothetical protein